MANNVAFSYRLKGPLLTNPTEATKKGVTTALRNTSFYGRRLVKTRTRVDTGRMRRGWQFAEKRWDEYHITNAVPYLLYWEQPDRIMVGALPFIQDELNAQVKEHVTKELNG